MKSNPYEVDVSKEDIATSRTSQAEAEFFGVKREEESMPAARSRRTSKVVEEEQLEGTLAQVEGPNLVVNSPRHLWGLGSFKIHYRVMNADELANSIHDAQDFFEWVEGEFADRLADVAALENQISIAQKELLGTLAEEVGEELPDLTDYSKTEASKLIRELLAAREPSRPTSQSRTGGGGKRTGGGSRRSRPARRPTSQSRTSGGRAQGRSSRTTGGRAQGRSSRTTGGRTGRRTGGGRRPFDNEKPGGATDKMKDFLLDLCRQAGVDAPTDDELDNQMTYNEVSAEITELREALGYENS